MKINITSENFIKIASVLIFFSLNVLTKTDEQEAFSAVQKLFSSMSA